MLDELTETLFCASTMCYGSSATSTRHQDVEPSTPRRRLVAGPAYAHGQSVGNLVVTRTSSHGMPFVIRMDTSVTLSSVRDGVVTEQRDQPASSSSSSSSSTSGEKTTPQWDKNPMDSPLLMHIKKANPIVMKENYNDDEKDDETVSTKSTEMSFSSWSPGGGSITLEEEEEGEDGISMSSSVELNWNDAVIEDTDEGVKIHAPPELLLRRGFPFSYSSSSLSSSSASSEEEKNRDLIFSPRTKPPKKQRNGSKELMRRLRRRSPPIGIFAKDKTKEG